MEYGSEVQRLFAAPLHCGELPPNVPGLASGGAEDRTQPVWVRFQLEVAEGVVRRARYRVFGCQHPLAAAERGAEWLEGRPATALAAVDLREIGRALGVPAEKLGKLLRIEDALAACRRSLETRTELNDGDTTD